MPHTISTPRGFHSTCELLNIISSDPTLFETYYEVAQLKTKDFTMQQTLLQLTHQSPILLAMKPDDATIAVKDFTMVNIQNMIDTISHIALGFAKDITTVDREECANMLKNATILTVQTIKVLVPLLYGQSSIHEKTEQKSNDAFTIGRIIGTQYKIGLAISSSSCEKVFEPFVTLSLTIDKPHEGQQFQSYELSVSDYHRLQITFNEIKQAMDDMM